MLTRDDNLEIFDNFRVDFQLPKYKKRRMQASGISQKRPWNVEDSDELTSEDAGPNIFFNSGQTLVSNTTVEARPVIRWYHKLWRLLNRNPFEPAPVPVSEFFRSVKNSVEELVVVQSRASGYETAIKQAKENGQTALHERLQKSLVAVRAETQLLAIGMTKFLDEAKLVEFVKKSKKGLRLDWIANFTRMVPKHAICLKDAADEREIFDNYVILHYDPDAKSWAETEAEKAARRDPILFGLIDGRRRLYFVDEWEDEFCDLSLDQIADVLGGDAVGEIKKDSF